MTEATCSSCGRTQKSKPNKSGEGVKLPLRWKRDADGRLVCGVCWRSRYVLRALTFAVASPISGTWKELETSLRAMWAVTTKASNWMMTQCYVRDAPREGEKIPPMPRLYLYPEARILFPDLPPRSVASLEQVVQRKYRSKRFDVMWRSAASLPTMRYPQPYPIPNQGWSYHFNEQSQLMVACRIGEQNWELRLKTGARYRRQIDGLRRMAERGEMAIYKLSDGTMLVKLVGWLERPKVGKTQGTLFVRTGKDHLLSALDVKNERIWIENCDHLPRWTAEHRKRLQRFSEDQKAEQRPVATFAERRSAMAEKQRHRLHSAIQEVAAHLVNFAKRRHYAEVRYDDTDRWMSEFPYFALEERIRIKLDEYGIGFQKTSGAVTEEKPLAEE
jgi:hypothetical protein